MTPKPQPPLDLWEQLDHACDMMRPVRTSDTFTIRELAARRNISYAQARNLVYKMEASGLVERVGGTPVLFRMKREEVSHERHTQEFPQEVRDDVRRID